MTDQELKDLVASLALGHKAFFEELQVSKEAFLEELQVSKEAFLEELQVSKEAFEEELQVSKKTFEEELRKSGEEFDRKLEASKKEADISRKEINLQLKELGKQIGGLGNKFGSFTEGMAFPAMEKILRQQFGMETISTRVKSTKNGENLEIDVLAYANTQTNSVYIVEVKSHLRERDLQQMLTLMQRFPNAFPEHNDKELYGVIATVDASSEIKQEVLNAGIYLAQINDEQFILNPPESFKPYQFNPLH